MDKQILFSLLTMICAGDDRILTRTVQANDAGNAFRLSTAVDSYRLDVTTKKCPEKKWIDGTVFMPAVEDGVLDAIPHARVVAKLQEESFHEQPATEWHTRDFSIIVNVPVTK